jgi:hypothetical protein
MQSDFSEQMGFVRSRLASHENLFDPRWGHGPARRCRSRRPDGRGLFESLRLRELACRREKLDLASGQRTAQVGHGPARVKQKRTILVNVVENENPITKAGK